MMVHSMAQVQSVDDKIVFVSWWCEWSLLWVVGVCLTYWSERAWCSWFLQSVRLWAVGREQTQSCDDGCPWHSRCFFGTPLRTWDHCFVSCVLRVEQSEPEYNVRSIIFLKHHTYWDNVLCAGRSYTWSTILRSANPLDAFNWAIGEVLDRIVPTTVLHCWSGDEQWFDDGCQRAYDAKQSAIIPGVEHAV